MQIVTVYRREAKVLKQNCAFANAACSPEIKMLHLQLSSFNLIIFDLPILLQKDFFKETKFKSQLYCRLGIELRLLIQSKFVPTGFPFFSKAD